MNESFKLKIPLFNILDLCLTPLFFSGTLNKWFTIYLLLCSNPLVSSYFLIPFVFKEQVHVRNGSASKQGHTKNALLPHAILKLQSQNYGIDASPSSCLETAVKHPGDYDLESSQRCPGVATAVYYQA